MNKRLIIDVAIIVSFVCMLIAVNNLHNRLTRLEQSYELTDQELLDLEDELNYKGYIDGKKKD